MLQCLLYRLCSLPLLYLQAVQLLHQTCFLLLPTPRILRLLLHRLLLNLQPKIILNFLIHQICPCPFIQLSELRFLHLQIHHYPIHFVENLRQPEQYGKVENVQPAVTLKKLTIWDQSQVRPLRFPRWLVALVVFFSQTQKWNQPPTQDDGNTPSVRKIIHRRHTITVNQSHSSGSLPDPSSPLPLPLPLPSSFSPQTPVFIPPTPHLPPIPITFTPSGNIDTSKQKKMVCEECLFQLEPNDKFCGSCGHRQSIA